MLNDYTILRPLEDLDTPFVHNSWVESCWFRYKNVPNAKNLISKRISFLLKQCPTLLCTDKEDPRVIYGYVNYDTDNVNWIYVKYPFRQQGIATLLLDHVPTESLKMHTHTSKAGEHLVKRYESKFTPFIYEKFL